MTDDGFPQRYKWFDPDPDDIRAGILLSDRIQFYVEKVRLIDPFHEESLQPASYNLHVGNEYYLNDRRCKPGANGEIVIPRNGLVFVTLEEQLNLPCYIVAQHDLKVKQVYRGFLAGRSLQIDPGYSGHIHYPIYNFTSERKVVHVGDEITTMCFIKTTPLGDLDFRRLGSSAETSVDELQDLVTSPVKGLGGCECIVFPESKDRQIPEYWLDFGGEPHMNSVEALERSVKSMLKTWRRYRNIAILAVLSRFSKFRKWL